MSLPGDSEWYLKEVGPNGMSSHYMGACSYQDPGPLSFLSFCSWPLQGAQLPLPRALTNDILPHHRHKSNRTTNHELKPPKLWTKVNFASSWLSQVYILQQWKLINTNIKCCPIFTLWLVHEFLNVFYFIRQWIVLQMRKGCNWIQPVSNILGTRKGDRYFRIQVISSSVSPWINLFFFSHHKTKQKKKSVLGAFWMSLSRENSSAKNKEKTASVRSVI